MYGFKYGKVALIKIIFFLYGACALACEHLSECVTYFFDFIFVWHINIFEVPCCFVVLDFGIPGTFFGTFVFFPAVNDHFVASKVDKGIFDIAVFVDEGFPFLKGDLWDVDPFYDEA